MPNRKQKVRRERGLKRERQREIGREIDRERERGGVEGP